MMQTFPGFRERDRSEGTQLIELTAKRWKAFMVIAAGLGLLGMAFMLWQVWAGIYQPLMEQGFASEGRPRILGDAFLGPAGIVGMAIFAAGLAVAIYARFMAWWHHG